jgi:hypothetical protein
MTTKLKTELETAREALAAALAGSTAGDEQLAKLERDRANIVSQIEKLESQTERAPEDSDAVARLSTLREQQRLFDKKIAKLQDEHRYNETPRRTLDEATEAAGGLLIQSAQPELDKLLSEARVAFTPFYRDPTRLRLAIERNDRILSLKAHLINAGPGPVNEKPARLLLLLDGLIAGNGLGWTWQPSPADSK